MSDTSNTGSGSSGNGDEAFSSGTLPGAGAPGTLPPMGGGQAGYIPPSGAGGFAQPLMGAPMAGGFATMGPQRDGMAVAAMVCSIAGVLCGVSAIVGFILGLVSLSKIKKSGGALGGRGMALAGVIVGAVVVVVGITILIIALAVGNHCNHDPNTTFCVNVNTNNGN